MSRPKQPFVDRVPDMPTDLHAEQSLLGCLMMGNLRAGELLESMTHEDFYDSRHQAVYSVLRAMWSRNLPMGTSLLLGELEAAGAMETAGGIGYVTGLIDQGIGGDQILRYRDAIKAKRVLRELAFLGEAARNAAIEAHRTGAPVGEVIDEILSKLATLSNGAQSENRGKTRLEAASNLLYSLENYGDQVRIFVDLPKIDEATGGFRAGELVMLSAESGVGKSYFAAQINRRSCSDGHHCLYASGEMLAEHLMGRGVASDSGVPYMKIRRPELLDSSDRRSLMESGGRQCKICRIIDGDLTLARIRSGARAMASNKELGLFIVDYDELVEVKGKDEWDQQRILVRSMKSLAMELKVPGIIVSQMSKSKDPQDHKRPTLARLYGSSSKAKHASFVLHVDRPYVRDLKGDETAATIFILKSRDGRQGRTPCTFNTRNFHFEQKAEEVPEA